MSGNRKNKGSRLEAFVAALLEPIYKYSRPTIASGATPVEKGDVSNPYFLIECKSHDTKSFSINNDTWNKLIREAAREYKDAIYITENSSGNKLVSMELNSWVELVTELIEYRDAYGWVE